MPFRTDISQFLEADAEPKRRVSKDIEVGIRMSRKIVEYQRLESGSK